MPRLRRRCDSVHPLHFRGRSSPAERSFDMREEKRAALFAPTIFRGHSSASQSGCFTCIRSKARILLPSPFLSLWCSPVNMPAPHAGDHRSEAGQGRQFMPPKHCQRCIRSVTESARCNSGWGLQFQNRRSRTSVQAGVISQPRPGQHRGLRPSLPLCSSLRISFVKRSCRCNSDGRLQSFCSRSPMQRHDVESVDSAGASPAASTISACKH